MADIEEPPAYMKQYPVARKLPNGEWAAIYPQIYTTAIIVGVDELGYRTRFCYECFLEAVTALAEWNGEGFPPGYWIKQKPEGTPGPARP